MKKWALVFAFAVSMCFQTQQASAREKTLTISNYIATIPVPILSLEEPKIVSTSSDPDSYKISAVLEIKGKFVGGALCDLDTLGVQEKLLDRREENTSGEKSSIIDSTLSLYAMGSKLEVLPIGDHICGGAVDHTPFETKLQIKGSIYGEETSYIWNYRIRPVNSGVKNLLQIKYKKSAGWSVQLLD